MQECGDFNNCPIAEAVRAIAVDNGKQTVSMQQMVKNVEAITYTLNGNGKPGLVGRVESLERRGESHDAAAKLDREKRDRRFAFWARIFWLVIAPVMTAVGIGAARIGYQLVDVLTSIQGHQR